MKDKRRPEQKKNTSEKGWVQILLRMVLLIGACLSLWVAMVGFRGAFNAPYVQLIGLLLGVFFGGFGVVCLLGTILYPKDHLMQWHWLKKLKFLKKYLRSMMWFLVSMILSGIALSVYSGDSVVSIAETTAFKSQVKYLNDRYGVRRVNQLEIETTNQPGFLFVTNLHYLKGFDHDGIRQLLKPGKQVEILIRTSDWNGKIKLDGSLPASQRMFNFYVIPIYGLKVDGYEYLSLESVNASKSENRFGAGMLYFVFALLGLFVAIMEFISAKSPDDQDQGPIVHTRPPR